jgi:hypothetical protein
LAALYSPETFICFWYSRLSKPKGPSVSGRIRQVETNLSHWFRASEVLGADSDMGIRVRPAVNCGMESDLAGPVRTNAVLAATSLSSH